MYLQCWLFVRQTSLAYSFVIFQRKEGKKFDLNSKKRFDLGQTIPGTRSYHFFKPVNSNAYKRTAEDDALAGSFNITGEACFVRMTTESLRLNEYVACKYDKK